MKVEEKIPLSYPTIVSFRSEFPLKKSQEKFEKAMYYEFRSAWKASESKFVVSCEYR